MNIAQNMCSFFVMIRVVKRRLVFVLVICAKHQKVFKCKFHHKMSLAHTLYMYA